MQAFTFTSLSEQQVEAIVEKQMDRLDKQFMSGKLSQQEYDREVAALDKWASQQVQLLTL